MSLPTTLRGFWAGTHAGIPANWLRDTDFDTKYLLGAATAADAGTTGGSTTHVHTASGTRNHAIGSHTHTITRGAGSGAQRTGMIGTTTLVIATHTHTSPSTSYANSATTSNAPASVDATSNDPSYYEIIVLKPDPGSLPDGLADDMMGMFDAATAWQFCNGDNGSPDLRQKWLKVAAAAGDAGGTGGSLEAHTHASNHTHTFSHIHTSAVMSGLARGATTNGQTFSGGSLTTQKHTHTLSLSSSTASTSSSSANVQNADGRPPWYELYPAQNQTGAEDMPDQIILPYTGTHAGIPTDFARYTAMDDNFLECTNVIGEIGDTGGANQHSHTANAHTHTATHNHVVVVGTSSLYIGYTVNSPFIYPSSFDHTHSATSAGNASPTVSSTAITVDNCASKANYPEYRTVIWVQYTAPAVAGGSIKPFTRFRRGAVLR